MKIKTLGAVLLALGIVTGGCGHSSERSVMVDSPKSAASVQLANTQEAIYIDGTSSMYGYVNYQHDTAFVEAVRNIERTMRGIYDSEKITYIKFGDEFKKLSRDSFIESNKVDFYNQLDTSLENVIAHTDANKLNVVVTDLFQTNQDIDSLVQQLKNKYLVQGKALAIIGMKSQFNGKIYDIGKTQAAFSYQSGKDETSYRPFYLVVMGPELDVRKFTAEYKMSMQKITNTKAVLLAHEMGEDTTVSVERAMDNGLLKDTAKMATVTNLVSDPNIPQFRLRLKERFSGAKLLLHSKEMINAMPSHYTFVQNDVERLKVQDEKAQDPDQRYAFEKVEGPEFLIGEVLSAEENDEGATIEFDVKVSPIEVKKVEGQYRVNYSLIPEKGEYINEIADVFMPWNVNSTEVRLDPNHLKDIGNKTLNIVVFTQMLANINYSANNPGFHNNYIYFEAKK